MKFSAVLPVILITVVIISAGCIIEENRDPGFPSSDEMNKTLNEFIDSLKFKADMADSILTKFSHELEDAGDLSDEEINKRIRDLYIDNIAVSYVSYYDSESDKTYYTPYLKATGLTKEIYNSVGFDEHKTIIYGPIFSENHGVICAYIHPVYKNGKVTGIVAAYDDPVKFVSDCAKEIGGLNGLGPVILDSDGVVIYSPITTEIGYKVSEITEVADKSNLVNDIFEKESGVSGIIKGYTPGIYTKPLRKVAVWDSTNIYGKDAHIALIANEKYEAIPKDYEPDYNKLEKSVKNAYIYANEYGKENTIQALNNGTLTFGDLDVCAFDINGKLLASQKRPYQVGLSLINYRSSYGTKAIDTWGDIAQTSGGGYHFFSISTSEDPADTNTVMMCVYIMLVDSDWYLAAMIPVGETGIKKDLSVTTSLEKTMQNALGMYEEDAENAFNLYMNRAGTPLEGDENRIVVFNYEGDVLSSSAYPNTVGTNQLGLSMPSTGISVTRILIMKAEDGGGYITVDLGVDSTEYDNICVAYIEPLDDSFIVVYKPVYQRPVNKRPLEVD